MPYVKESGHQGPIVSLGGVTGQPGLGRQVRTEYFAVVSTVQRQILDDNPRRISAIIYSNSDGAITLYFTPDTNGPIAVLQRNDYLIINSDFPWTGPIWGINAALTGQVYIAEVSVQ